MCRSGGTSALAKAAIAECTGGGWFVSCALSVSMSNLHKSTPYIKKWHFSVRIRKPPKWMLSCAVCICFFFGIQRRLMGYPTAAPSESSNHPPRSKAIWIPNNRHKAGPRNCLSIHRTRGLSLEVIGWLECLESCFIVKASISTSPKLCTW